MKYKKHEWLLCFKINGQKISRFQWMYVDYVVPVEEYDVEVYQEDYSFQAIQVHDLKRYPPPPFEFDGAFKTACEKAIREYGLTSSPT